MSSKPWWVCVRFRCALVVAALCGSLLPAGRSADEPKAAPGPGTAVPSTTLHNLFRIDDSLYSGSAPETPDAFKELKKLGIKVIVSVDGSKPDVELAHQFGMRYVHLPIGYDGLAHERAVELMKAAQDAEGPIYMHCHHGKHRGPAAVATVCESIKGWDPEKATSFLKQAGTAPDYAGLFRSIREFRAPTQAELAKAPDRFPEIAKTPPLVDVMVNIDERFDALKAAEKAKWKEVPGNPDLTPDQAAKLLWEDFKELVRDKELASREQTFRMELNKSEAAARKLHELLGQGDSSDEARAAAVKSVSDSCAACHKKHRN